MATIRQPTVYDYASPSQFRIVLDKIPNVEWFVVSANVPGVNIGEALFPTPMVDLGLIGDKITYETLDVTFLVDEELINYRELHKWITDISFPFSRASYATATSTNVSNAEKAPDTPIPATDQDLYSECTLQILNSKNIAKVELRFKDIFPISLSGLDYNQQQTDVEYLQALASFRYSYYDIIAL